VLFTVIYCYSRFERSLSLPTLCTGFIRGFHSFLTSFTLYSQVYSRVSPPKEASLCLLISQRMRNNGAHTGERCTYGRTVHIREEDPTYGHTGGGPYLRAYGRGYPPMYGRRDTHLCTGGGIPPYTPPG